MEYTEFLENQERIYQEFEQAKKDLYKTGINSRFSENSSASLYSIAFKHNDKISNSVVSFSKEINKIVPSSTYEVGQIHTSITDAFVSSSLEYEPKKIELLIDVVENTYKKFKPFKINYKKWMVNKDTIIAAGYANREFFEISKAIIKEASEKGISLRYPYMAHITVSRFSKSVKDKDNLEKLISIVENTKPLGETMINKIRISYAERRGVKFSINTAKILEF